MFLFLGCLLREHGACSSRWTVQLADWNSWRKDVGSDYEIWPGCVLWRTKRPRWVPLFHVILTTVLATQRGNWLRHYATCRKFADSIPDGAIAIFHWLNPSACTVVLGSTQPVTKMGTRVLPAGGGGGGLMQPVLGADNFTTFMCRLSRNSGSLNLLAPYGPVQAFREIALLTMVCHMWNYWVFGLCLSSVIKNTIRTQDLRHSVRQNAGRILSSTT
jgi:hypothetical protein